MGTTTEPSQKLPGAAGEVTDTVEAFRKTAEYFRSHGNPAGAETQLLEALRLDPDHLASKLLLAAVLIEVERLDEGLEQLEQAYRIDQPAARQPLLAALLAKAAVHESQADVDQALVTYERALEVCPEDPTARGRFSDLWRERADAALAAEDLDEAASAYAKAGLDDQVALVEERKRQRAIDDAAREAHALEEQERWHEACAHYEWLVGEEPENSEWTNAWETAKVEAKLADLYLRAQEALENSEWATAQDALLEVLIVRADYKDAPEKLVQAVRKEETVDSSEPGPEPQPVEQDGEQTIDPAPPIRHEATEENAGQQSHEAPPNPLKGRFRWLPIAAAVLAVLGLVIVGYLVTAPVQGAENTLELIAASRSGDASRFNLSVPAIARGMGSFLMSDRVLPAAPITMFLGFLLAGFAGRALFRRAASSGYSMRGQPSHDSAPEPATDPVVVDYALLQQQTGALAAQPARAPVEDSPKLAGKQAYYESLGDEELRSEACRLASEIQSFLENWKETIGEASSFAPPTNEDSIQRYIDHLEKLDKFHREFERDYRPLASAIEKSFLERLPAGERVEPSLSSTEEEELSPERVKESLEELAQMSFLTENSSRRVDAPETTVT